MLVSAGLRSVVLCPVSLLIGLLLADVGQAHPGSVSAGQVSSDLVLPDSYEGPPPPELPAVVARDSAGRVTLRTVRLPGPLSVDGRLDEAIYVDAPSISDFIQNDPAEGQPATEKTEVWLFF